MPLIGAIRDFVFVASRIGFHLRITEPHIVPARAENLDIRLRCRCTIRVVRGASFYHAHDFQPTGVWPLACGLRFSGMLPLAIAICSSRGAWIFTRCFACFAGLFSGLFMFQPLAQPHAATPSASSVPFGWLPFHDVWAAILPIRDSVWFRG